MANVGDHDVVTSSAIWSFAKKNLCFPTYLCRALRLKNLIDLHGGWIWMNYRNDKGMKSKWHKSVGFTFILDINGQLFWICMAIPRQVCFFEMNIF